MTLRLPDREKAATILLLLVITLTGLFIRYDNVNHWQQNRDSFYSSIENIPIPLAVDSYYYLDIARDILEGKGENPDWQRQAPGSYLRPVARPLLAEFLALGARVTGRPLEWIAVFLPPLLSILLVLPLYLLAATLFSRSRSSSIDGSSATILPGALTAVLIALISPAYVDRGSLGWCDTDILNVTLMVSLTLTGLLASMEDNSRKLSLFLTCHVLLTVFFLQWWDQAPAPVIVFSLGYLLAAALFNVPARRHHLGIFILALALLLLIMAGLKGEALLSLPDQLVSLFKYSVSRDTSGMDFFAGGQLVEEQQDVPFTAMTTQVAGNPWVFALALAGLCLLAVTNRKGFLFLLPWIILATMAFKSHRLLIFSSVVASLGTGACIHTASCLMNRLSHLRLLPVAVAAILLAWFPFQESQSRSTHAPRNSPVLLDGFRQLDRVIPEGSILWTSWAHGHPLSYLTRLKTIGDGIFHPPQLVFSQYVPLATGNFRLAANWICFYSVQGLDGIARAVTLLTGAADNWTDGIPALKNLLAAGPDAGRRILRKKYGLDDTTASEMLRFFFPNRNIPIFLLLDYATFREQWFSWGTLPANHDYTMVPIYTFTQKGATLLANSELGELTVNLQQGSGNLAGSPIRLKEYHADNGRSPFTHSYNALPGASTLMLTQIDNRQFGALVDDKVLHTVFTKLYFLRQYDKHYFQPVVDAPPTMFVYQVTGDQSPGPVVPD